jgi:hypothetical protein
MAILTLAAGLAVNTTIATVVSGFALRTIPAAPGARVVRLYPLTFDGRRENLFSPAERDALRHVSSGIRELVAYIPEIVTVRTAGSSPRDGLAYFVSGNYFEVLGAASAEGRLIARSDDTARASAVAVISAALRGRLGRDQPVLGRTITLNGRAFTIVGVASPSFAGSEPIVADVWVPLAADPAVPGAPCTNADRNCAEQGNTRRPVLLLATLDSGASTASLEGQVSAVVRNVTSTLPAERRRTGAMVARATFFPVERDPLAVGALVLLATWLLLAATAANVGNLVLARGVARRRETAIRLAMGAGRLRIARQLLLEVLVLAAAAGILGLLLSSWALSVLYAAALPHVPYRWGTVLLDLRPDWRVFAYTSGACLLVTFGIGLAPVADANRVAITSALHGSPVFLGGRWGRWHARSLLVITQVSVSLALAIVAASRACGSEN